MDWLVISASYKNIVLFSKNGFRKLSIGWNEGGGKGLPVNDMFENTKTNFEINGYRYFIWKASIYDSDLYVNAENIGN